jgi:hypothetical protein
MARTSHAFLGENMRSMMKGNPASMRFGAYAAKRAGGQLSNFMGKMAKNPRSFGLVFGSLLALPTVFRGLAGAMSPMTNEYPKMSTGNAATAYGMDSNHLNTQGLVQAMHYGRR